MEHSYEIVGLEQVEAHGKIYSCFKIIGKGTSILGESLTTCFFNEKVGFVKMESIDPFKNKFNLELIKASNYN